VIQVEPVLAVVQRPAAIHPVASERTNPDLDGFHDDATMRYGIDDQVTAEPRVEANVFTAGDRTGLFFSAEIVAFDEKLVFPWFQIGRTRAAFSVVDQFADEHPAQFYFIAVELQGEFGRQACPPERGQDD
jgi:hypothetical protein